MTEQSKSVAGYSPAPFGESSGTATLFLFSNEASSGVGLTSGVAPLFVSAEQKSSSNIPMVTDGFLADVWSAIGSNWSYTNETFDQLTTTSGSTRFSFSNAAQFIEGSFRSTSKARSTGYIQSPLNLFTSGSVKSEIFSVMPLFVSESSTGNASGTMTLFAINQESATGQTTLVIPRSHEFTSSNLDLAVKGSNAASTGFVDMSVSGIGFLSNTATLFTAGKI